MNIFPDPLSPEDRFFIGLVARHYRVLLGRTADLTGLHSKVEKLRHGVPFSAITAEELESEEFRARWPEGVKTNAVIDALFEAAYGRPVPRIDREQPPGAYAALLLDAAERAAPSQLCDLFYPDGVDPTDGASYGVWRQDFQTPDPAALRNAAAEWPDAIAVSLVLLPGPASAGLTRTLESLLAQICSRFELVVAGRPQFCATVSSRLPGAVSATCTRAGLAAAYNAALPRCTGRFVLALRPGFQLAPDAVWHLAKAAFDSPDAAALLLDHDRIDSIGRHMAPTLHAGWDPDVALCRTDWVHGLALRTTLVKAAGGALAAAGAAAPLELAMRVIGAAGHDRVRCIPRSLLHRSTAHSMLGRLLEAVAEAVRRRAWARQVSQGPSAPRLVRIKGLATPRLVHRMPPRKPTVSVVIPTRDKLELLRSCLDGLLHRTNYESLEILVVDNLSEKPETFRYLMEIERDPRVRILSYDREFNWGAINNFAVGASSGEIVLLLNNDTEVLTPDWLDELVTQALRPEIGAVGAKLLYHDRTVQHAGLTLGPDGHAFHRFRHEPDGKAGYRDELMMVRNVSAVTGACIAMRRAVFDEIGGIEEAGLRVTWSDADLCFRIRAAGYRVICTPFAPLLHLELATRGADDTPARMARAENERQFMMKRWPSLANDDPFFNANFRLAERETRLSCAPRIPL